MISPLDNEVECGVSVNCHETSEMTSTDINRVPSFKQQYKLLMLGDSGVGKSSIILRYTRNVFSASFLPTIGIDMRFKDEVLPPSEKSPARTVRLFLWDTAGQERFRAITRSYLRGSHGIVIVYDVTDRKSFEHVEQWLATIEEMSEQALIVLVANKVDRPNHQVSEEEGCALAMDRGLAFFCSSAKEGEGVDHVFLHLAMRLDDQTRKRRSSASSLSSSVSSNLPGQSSRIQITKQVLNGNVAAPYSSCCGGT